MEEGLSYPCSENKCAGHLRGYREADLRLCFRICKKPVFSQRGSYINCVFARSQNVPHNLIKELKKQILWCLLHVTHWFRTPLVQFMSD